MAMPEHVARVEFQQDYQGNPVETDDPIMARINAIDPATSKAELVRFLQPILRQLSRPGNAARAEAYFETLRNRFSLSDDDIKAYRKDIRSFTRQKADGMKTAPISQQEVMNRLSAERDTFSLNPAQDYRDGVMFFAIRCDGISFLLTSEKKIIAFDMAESEGLRLEQASVDTARFSSNGIIRYVENCHSVTSAELYRKIYRYITRFIFFSDQRWAHLLSLWTMGTYVFRIFSYFPYIWLNAEKGSGKSLLMKVMSKIAFNGEVLIHPTLAVVFRDVSQNSIAMFIDEVEQLRKQDKELHNGMISLLNNGFEKSGVVKRTEKGKDGNYEIKKFTPFSPKMFAGINEIDDVLQDRTIRVQLLRKKQDEQTERYKESEWVLESQREIRDDLYTWALTQAKQLADLYESGDVTGTDHLTNRELDIWEPIILIANLIDTETGNAELTCAMESLSRQSMEEKQEDSRSSNETYKLLCVMRNLLVDLSPVCESDGIIYFKAEDVFEYFKQTEEYEWMQTRNVLTVRLKKIKVKAERMRLDGSKKIAVYRLKPDEIEDLCQRML